MKKHLLALAIGTGLSAGAWAQIALPTNEPVYFQFNNLEQVSGFGGPSTNTFGPYENNWGVFNISTIQHGGVSTPNVDISGGPAFFFDDGPGGTQGQVTGIFYGVTINDATNTRASGGFIDLYWNAPGTDTITANDLSGAGATPAIRTATDKATGFTDGTFLARLVFASGIDPLDGTTFLKSTTDISTINASGNADSFANVVDINGDGKIDGLDGFWAAALNGDWFNTAFGTRDLRFSTFYNGLASWNGAEGINGLRSNDPARVFTASVPEPATLALMGLGLVGMGAVRRKKAARNR